MVRMRRFEEKAGMLYALGTLAAPCPLGYGQEAAIAAIADSLQPADMLVSLEWRPALDLALGDTPASVFQRLVPPIDPAGVAAALLYSYGEQTKRLPHHMALAAFAEAKTGICHVVAFDPADLAPLLEPRNRVLAVLVIPSDRRPEVWPLPADVPVRECDGASLGAVEAALAGARDALSSAQNPLVLVILTPPYAGHARDTGRRANRRDTPDPLALFRDAAIASGQMSNAEAVVIENTVRDEIATAGRAISLSCAP
jgi:pyruvate dehydrogenase E1 component alpha subunit